VAAQAAPPLAWSGRGCTGCHGNPSADLQTWPTSTQLSDLTSSNFRSKLNTQNGTMEALAALQAPFLPDTQSNVDDRAAILQYLLAVRDVPVPASLSFTATPIGSAGTLSNLVITNERSRNVTYSAPSFSPSGDFTVDSETCSSRIVPADGGTCTVTIRFKPTSGSGGSRSSTLSLSIAGTGGDNSPGAKSVSLSGTAQLPLELTPAGPLGFVALFTSPASTSDPQNVAIANRLNSDLRLCLRDVTATGTGSSAPGDFNLVGLTLPASAPRCTTVSAPGPAIQSITFTPTAGNPRVARFTVERDAGGGTWTDLQFIDLEGNAGPLAIFSGASLNGTGTALFDGVRQDKNLGAALATVTLTNAGAHPLQVVGIGATLVAGATTPEYAPTGCASVTLNSGQSCDVTVSFDPAEAGLRSSQLRIDYVDASVMPAPPSQSSTLALLGRGFVGPELEVRNELGTVVAPGTLIDFGRQNINVNYSRRFTLRNLGTDEALLLSAATVLPVGSGFSLVAPAGAGASPCSALVQGATQSLAPKDAAGDSCVVDVRFSPTQERIYSAQLSMHTQPETSSVPAPGDYQLALAGEGANDIPVLLWLDVNGNSLSTVGFPLPATPVGSASPPAVKIRLQNAGKGAAALKLLNLVGPDAANFTIDLSDPGACPVGEQAQPLLEGPPCDVVIRFAPQTAGNKQASLQLVSSGSTPQPILVTAQAAGPAGGVDVSLTPASVNFATVRVGAESAPISITIANNGVFPAVVTSIQADQPFAVLATTCAGMPFTLAPGASCTMAARFLPTADGQATGTLQVAVDGRATPAAASLSGDGVSPADLSSGGCTLSQGTRLLDPTLWLLALFAVAALYLRRQQRQRMPAGGERSRRAP
jgi:hypothetical protein